MFPMIFACRAKDTARNIKDGASIQAIVIVDEGIIPFLAERIANAYEIAASSA